MEKVMHFFALQSKSELGRMTLARVVRVGTVEEQPDRLQLWAGPCPKGPICACNTRL